MYILYNADGSVKSKKLDQYIQQGNSYSNVLFVSIAEHRNFTLAGICTLPNGVKTTCTISPLETTQVIDGVTYYGKTLSITESETISAGTIRINVSATENSQVLVTFSVYLTVNETAYDSNNPVLVSWQQYNTLVTEVGNISSVEFQTTTDPTYTYAKSVKVTKNGQSTYYKLGEGTDYTAGTGIDSAQLAEGVIVVDTTTIATKTDLTSKEDKSNKVSSWQETPDDTHYPSEKLVKDSIDDVREIAEGKVQAITISNTDTLASIKAYLENVSTAKAYLENGEEITASIKSGETYLVLNNLFTNDGISTDYIMLQSTGYVASQKNNDYYFYKADNNGLLAKKGNEILITQTNVPDWWSDGYQTVAGTTGIKVRLLETRKIDIASKEDKSNKVTSISALSTDTQYPSAKCVYDIIGNIETLLGAI